jgi:hypothetical protein
MEYEKYDGPLELTYKNSIFHRIVPNGWVQGGGTKRCIFNHILIKNILRTSIWSVLKHSYVK